jgi:MoxR-like ATPase
METSSVDIRELNERIQKESAFIDLINLEMDKVIVGQKYMVERLMIGLLSNGHILLEGVPGLAKTLAIKSLSSKKDDASETAKPYLDQEMLIGLIDIASQSKFDDSPLVMKQKIRLVVR